MTPAAPRGTAGGGREAKHDLSTRLPGRRATFRPATGQPPLVYSEAIAAAAVAAFPSAPLVEVVERTADGRRVSEGFLVRHDGDEIQVVTRGEHYLVPPTAEVRDVVSGERIGRPALHLPEEVRQQVVGLLQQSLGWDWPASQDGLNRIPAATELLGEIADELSPILERERRAGAREALHGVVGLAVVIRDENEVEQASIDPNDVAHYALRWEETP